MLSEELRRRISELNRKNLKVWPLSQHPALKEDREPEPEPVAPEAMANLLGGEAVQRESGEFLRITHRMRDIQANAARFLDRYKFVFGQGGYTASEDELHKNMVQFLKAPYDRIIYLDIETCGLASSPIFLVGIMYPAEDDFVIEQLFARDYTEEPPLLSYLESELQRFEILVTFNGKTFDYPYIKERGLLNRIFFNPDMAHFDLLHESRRRWKEYLPDCKLQTIERHILKRRRSGDIPGEEIPEVYHEFVRTGEVKRIKSVLQHNLLDLVSMSEIVLHMIDGRDEE